jgi:hypothetical protein
VGTWAKYNSKLLSHVTWQRTGYIGEMVKLEQALLRLVEQHTKPGHQKLAANSRLGLM